MSEDILVDGWNAKERFRPQYHKWFGSAEIGELALESDFGGANGGLCPVGEMCLREINEYGCGAATCPVCNFCFKWHHPKGRHGEPSDYQPSECTEMEKERK